ncbi:MAG: hypothetical protein O3C40_16255 [Planctomycetota bacterium]|nr:hypothetical protein [Planctomycetota bacterium]
MLSTRNACLVIAACTVVPLCGCKRVLPPSVAVNDATIKSVRDVLEEGVASGGSGEAAVLADPTGWATLSGTFKINGAVPPNPPLKVDKDVEVCAPGGKQVLDNVVMVGPGGVLQNVLVYVSSKIPPDNPAWIHESYAAARDAEVIFDQKNCVFLSRMGTMWSTQKLKVLNSDPVGHNTKLDSVRGATGANISVPANGSADYEPGGASPAPFPVSCSIHPWMKASMMVCDHPYFAVTDANGAFSIPNVPAGVELQYRVWHEKAGYIQDVSVGGTGEKWPKGRFKRELADGDDVKMDVAIDAAVFQKP